VIIAYLCVDNVRGSTSHTTYMLRSFDAHMIVLRTGNRLDVVRVYAYAAKDMRANNGSVHAPKSN
jgi:hypothetical protein